MTERLPSPERMTLAQEMALREVCARYNVGFEEEHYNPVFFLPAGWYAGWIGGFEIQQEHPTIYVGCSPEGQVSS